MDNPSTPQITLNGRSYPLARFDELTLDEAMIVWDYTGMSLDQIPDQEGFHPGLIAALIHISVARQEDETKATIRRVVGKVPVAELQEIFAQFSQEVDDAELPPSNEPAASSEPNGASGSSGGGSSPPTASAPAPGLPSSTGSRGSADGSRSDRETYAT